MELVADPDFNDPSKWQAISAGFGIPPTGEYGISGSELYSIYQGDSVFVAYEQVTPIIPVDGEIYSYKIIVNDFGADTTGVCSILFGNSSIYSSPSLGLPEFPSGAIGTFEGLVVPSNSDGIHITLTNVSINIESISISTPDIASGGGYPAKHTGPRKKQYDFIEKISLDDIKKVAKKVVEKVEESPSKKKISKEAINSIANEMVKEWPREELVAVMDIYSLSEEEATFAYKSTISKIIDDDLALIFILASI